jgi:hypothetical protein
MSLGGTFVTVHSFTEAESFEDGALTSPLIQAADGRFYGTAAVGGTSANTVYSVSADGDLAIVHAFSSAEGSGLSGPLLETEPGVFYGTAREGGPPRMAWCTA